jgi:hypothetical protein
VTASFAMREKKDKATNSLGFGGYSPCRFVHVLACGTWKWRNRFFIRRNTHYTKVFCGLMLIQLCYRVRLKEIFEENPKRDLHITIDIHFLSQ